VWVDSDDGLTRLTYDLHRETSYPGISAGLRGDVFFDGTSVWLRDGDGTIFCIDAASGRVLERINPGYTLSGGSLIVAYGSIWTTDSEAGRVIRLRLAS
jgi:outer membrane protein assembly factor BamB